MGTSSSNLVGQFDGSAHVGAPGTPGRSGSLEQGEWMPTPSLRRPGDPLSGRTKILMASAIAALPAGYFFFGGGHGAVQVAAVPPPAIDLPPSESLPLREAQAPATTVMSIMTESPAEPEGRMASEPEWRMASSQPAARVDETPIDVKPAESGSAAGARLTTPERQTFPENGKQFASSAGNDSRCLSSPSVVRQNFPDARPSWTLRAPGHEGIKCWYPATRTVADAEALSANARVTPPESRGEPEIQTASSSLAARLGIEPAESAIDARTPQTSPEGGKSLAAASGYDPTCLPSASAVRQDYPQARPSWTLKAPGHEGTKCWFAARRTADDDHRSDVAPRKDAVGVPRQPGLPGTERPGMLGVLPGSE
jgi:hypothetical protein